MSIRVGYFMKANEGVYSEIRSALPSGCELVTLAQANDPAAILPTLDFLIAGKVTRSMIESGGKLRLIQTPGVGYDGIDLQSANTHAIPVAYTVCGNTVEVAEHTILLMLAVSRRLTEIHDALRNGEWMMWDRRVHSRTLQGKVLGIVGFGRIGQAVAQRAAAFGMIVQHHDPYSSDPGLDLDTLLATSDIVTLHVPLTADTRGLLSRGKITLIKRGSIVINTARGEVIDEPALIEALRSGHLAGAGLDVFAAEPPSPDNPLLRMPNVVLTPHVASGTLESLREKAAWYAQNITRVLEGKEPLDLVPGSVPSKGVAAQ